jgi:hypothetical protein
MLDSIHKIPLIDIPIRMHQPALALILAGLEFPLIYPIFGRLQELALSLEQAAMELPGIDVAIAHAVDPGALPIPLDELPLVHIASRLGQDPRAV